MTAQETSTDRCTGRMISMSGGRVSPGVSLFHTLDRTAALNSLCPFALQVAGVWLKQMGNKSQPSTSELRSVFSTLLWPVCVGRSGLLEESPAPVRTKAAAVGGRRHAEYTVVRV